MLAHGCVGVDPLGLEERGPIVAATLELGVQRKKKYLLGELALIRWRYGTGGRCRYRGAAVVKKIKENKKKKTHLLGWRR